MEKQDQKSIIKLLKKGKIGVLPTDTLYGLVGLALDKKTVERIYQVRQRTPTKPLIILISSPDDLHLFGIKPDQDTLNIIARYWPGKISIILPLPRRSYAKAGPDFIKKFSYLHRGKNSLAFRQPKNKTLMEILTVTGPLAAPSANPEGYSPAKNIKEAKNYFGDKIDFYLPAQAGLAGKIRASQPSTIIGIESGQIEVIRSGAVKIEK